MSSILSVLGCFFILIGLIKLIVAFILKIMQE